jgi:hypothetical protein
MRVIIAGSRSIVDYDQVLVAVDNSDFYIKEVVSGAARGVDALGERYALENSLPCMQFHADWDKYGRRAGPIRNSEMAKYADAAIVVWDASSTGSRNMIEQMKRLNKPCYVWKVI